MRYYVSKKTSVYELCGLILKIDMILVLNIVVMNGKLLKHISYSRNTTVLKFVTHPHLYYIIKWLLWPIPYYIWHQFRITSGTLITLSACYYIKHLLLHLWPQPLEPPKRPLYISYISYPWLASYRKWQIIFNRSCVNFIKTIN